MQKRVRRAGLAQLKINFKVNMVKSEVRTVKEQMGREWCLDVLQWAIEHHNGHH